TRCCRGLLRVANLAFLSSFLFSGLPRVAPYRVPGGVSVVSISPFLRPYTDGYEGSQIQTLKIHTQAKFAELTFLSASVNARQERRRGQD
ncbi:MAG: hypothetical protein M3441_26630, partial [Chloroflexota bacterium]|nr:hypothetical protein [Chloroflexota bacterium]